jgi:hypothetical protein
MFADQQPLLVCIARKLEDNLSRPLGIETFTTRQDLSGKVIAFDTR